MSGTNANKVARIYDSLSGRNRIINGACTIAQRASVTNTGSADVYGGPDRYYTVNNAGGSFTQSQGTLTYNGETKFAVTQTVNTATTGLTSSNYWHGIVQILEGFNCYDLSYDQISISFIFNTNVSGPYSVCLRDVASTNNSYVTSFTAVANTPKRYTFNLPAFGLSIPCSNADGMTLAIGFLNAGIYVTPTANQWNSGNYLCVSGATNWGATAGNFIQLTELQLEQGEFCTPFERRSQATEALLCQRYYQVLNGQLVIASANGNFGGGSTFLYGVPMRTSPTQLTAINTNSTGGITGTLAVQAFNTNCFQVWPGSGFTLSQWCNFQILAYAEF
jgi:hypothetical protein